MTHSKATFQIPLTSSNYSTKLIAIHILSHVHFLQVNVYVSTDITFKNYENINNILLVFIFVIPHTII